MDGNAPCVTLWTAVTLDYIHYLNKLIIISSMNQLAKNKYV